MKIWYLAACAFCLTVACDIGLSRACLSHRIADISTQSKPADEFTACESASTSTHVRILHANNWFSYCSKPFPVIVEGTGCRLLDSRKGEPVKLFYVRVLSQHRLELLDRNKQSIIQRLDSSTGWIRMRYPHQEFVNAGWPIPFAVRVPFLLLIATIAALYGSFTVLATAICIIVATTIAVVRSVGHRRYLTKHPTPLMRRLDEFREGVLQRQDLERCPRGPQRGIQVGKIMDLHDYFRVFIRDRTAYYLVGNIVQPLTISDRVSYAELVGASEVEWFVSHYWGTEFAHFCECLHKHARHVRPAIEALSDEEWGTSSEATMRHVSGTFAPASWRRVVYWVCFLSNNQYEIEEELGRGDWRQTSFYLTLRSGSIRGTCMVLDDQALPLTRSWCIFELLQTLLLEKEGLNSFDGLLLCTYSGCLNYGDGSLDAGLAVVEKIATLDLESATATNKEDEIMIANQVLEQMGSFADMHAFVQSDVRRILHATQDNTSKKFDVLYEKLAVAQSRRGSAAHIAYL